MGENTASDPKPRRTSFLSRQVVVSKWIVGLLLTPWLMAFVRIALAGIVEAVFVIACCAIVIALSTEALQRRIGRGDFTAVRDAPSQEEAVAVLWRMVFTYPVWRLALHVSATVVIVLAQAGVATF